MSEIPDWVIERKKENTKVVELFIENAMNGKLQIRGFTVLQQLKSIHFEVTGIVGTAKRSNVNKELWSKFIAYYKDLATIPIKKENLNKLETYIKLYKLQKKKANKLSI